MGYWHASCPKEAPLLVCGVSSRWRSIALSTPILWTNLSPVLSSSWCEAPLIELWLQRSSNSPLVLQLSDRPSYFNSKNTLDKICSLFISNAHRWTEVRITLNKDILPYFLQLRNIVCPMIDLAIVDFVTKDCSTEEKVDEILSVFPSFPQLRKLGLISTCFLDLTRMRMIPWPQLTYIGLSCKLTLDDCLTILSQCHMATEIRMRICDRTVHSDNQNKSTSGRISLPSLLSLALVTDPDAGSIMQFLDLPALRCLDICQVGWSGLRINANLLNRYFQQSRFQLKKLCIANAYCSPEVVLAYLSMPKVVEIPDVCVSSEAISQQILDAIKGNDNYSGIASHICINGKLAGWRKTSNPEDNGEPWYPLLPYSYTGVMLY